jgi:hypothetical protein
MKRHIFYEYIKIYVANKKFKYGKYIIITYNSEANKKYKYIMISWFDWVWNSEAPRSQQRSFFREKEKVLHDADLFFDKLKILSFNK